MHTSVIVIAGATGVLGGKIMRSLVDRKANVRALVRRGTPADWRREFHTRLDAAPIMATSIFNGAFTELLTGQAPYMCDMFSGLANVEQLDNQRYPELGWQSISDVLARFLRQQSN